MTRMWNGSFSVGLGHASSRVSYMIVSKYHFLYVESNIEQMYFEFILDGKITLLYKDNMFWNFQ